MKKRYKFPIALALLVITIFSYLSGVQYINEMKIDEARQNSITESFAKNKEAYFSYPYSDNEKYLSDEETINSSLKRLEYLHQALLNSFKNQDASDLAEFNKALKHLDLAGEEAFNELNSSINNIYSLTDIESIGIASNLLSGKSVELAKLLIKSKDDLVKQKHSRDEARIKDEIIFLTANTLHINKFNELRERKESLDRSREKLKEKVDGYNELFLPKKYGDVEYKIGIILPNSFQLTEKQLQESIELVKLNRNKINEFMVHDANFKPLTINNNNFTVSQTEIDSNTQELLKINQKAIELHKDIITSVNKL